MLLPSDVARLVLGYLQEEGLSATSQAFIHESPNLKEYADHTTGDGTVPACVFSIFGKGLTTILNEYVATKAKESHHEVPAVMTSLWKKLDFTLNQIKSLQNSPVISACQRTRSRIGVANMARQRVLTVASPGTIVCSSVSESSSIISPMHTSHGIFSHSTPLSSSAPLTQAAVTPATQQQIPDVRLNTPRSSLSGDSLAQTVVSEQRFNSGPMSPGRRKWDTPRKRAGAASAASAPSRCSTAVSGSGADPQLEEVVDENFPQLVIQNAREKMLGDRSLQEKLAENINKILASDPVPQISKTSTTALEADQSIDEILGLEGEIHMSDDAIHDILEQTESDPAFQALYDLFDNNKTRFADAEAGDGANHCFAEECATPSAVVKPLQSNDPGNTNAHVDALDTMLTTVKKKTGQERKLRKTSTLLKKTILRPSGRSSRIENSSARLLVCPGEPAGSAAAEKSHHSKRLPLSSSEFVPPMDATALLNPPPPPPPPDCTHVLKPVLKDSSSTSTAASPSATPSSLVAAVFAAPEFPPLSEKGQTLALKGQPGTVAITERPASTLVLPVTAELSSFPAVAANLPHMATPGVEGNTDTQPLLGCSSSHQSASPGSTSSLFTVAPGSQSVSTSVGLVTTSSSSTLASTAAPTSSTASACPAAVSAAHDGPPSKPGADPSVVALKIIISDDRDEDSCCDPALNQAVSSISGDKIPTIYLSSPARSPGVPGTPRISSDEVAQAVSGLQHSEGQASPLSSRAGTLVASPLAGTPALQQNYIIQLPLEAAAAPAVQGAPASYFLVTEPPHTDAQPRQVLLSAGVSKGPLPFSPYGVPAQASSPGYPTGSTLLLPSPAKPVMLPVSVVGQNAMGPVQMVSSQFVTIQNTVPVQQPVSGNSTSPTVSLSFSAPGRITREPSFPGTEPAETSAQTLAAENQGQQKAVAGPTHHKRILCFDSSAEGQPHPTAISTSSSAPNTSRPASAPHPKKDGVPVARTRPNILGGNRPKRRLQPVRCLQDHRTEEENLKEADTPKDPLKKHVDARAGTDRTESSQHKTGTDSERRSKSAAEGDPTSRASHSERNQDKEEGSKKEPPGKVASTPREGRVEKRAPSQDVPNVTGNKENEIKDTAQEKQAAASSFSQQSATQAVPEALPKTPRTPSKTSSLAKQAAEMLHNLQGHNQEESSNSPRTPGRQKKAKDGDGTPKHLLPPGTPEVPSCSPVSEAGSENSINMAAHTLMILSRATIARTGTPLKDSLRQDGVGEKIPTSSKNSKKRRLSSPADTPPAKKDHRERKKLVACFPRDLDVDKFLSSLHYDE